MIKCFRQDSWVIVPIVSLTKPEETMEGTRLTLVSVPNQPNGVEFSIRTPVTPPRWKQFDRDLKAAWDKIIDAFLSGKHPFDAKYDSEKENGKKLRDVF